MEHPAYHSCAIDLGHSVIVTGGWDSGIGDLSAVDRCPHPPPTVHLYSYTPSTDHMDNCRRLLSIRVYSVYSVY